MQHNNIVHSTLFKQHGWIMFIYINLEIKDEESV